MKKGILFATIVFFILFIIIGGIIIVGMFLQTSIADKKLSAFMIEAEYLDKLGVVFQTRDNNCGPSALKMIFNHFNINSTIDEIENKVGLTEKGSTMLALKEMAESKGLKVEGWRLTIQDLLTKPFPTLLFIHGDHYVVVDSIVNKEAFIRDPAIGRLRLNQNNLNSIWNGETLIFINDNMK